MLYRLIAITTLTLEYYLLSFYYLRTSQPELILEILLNNRQRFLRELAEVSILALLVYLTGSGITKLLFVLSGIDSHSESYFSRYAFTLVLSILIMLALAIVVSRFVLDPT